MATAIASKQAKRNWLSEVKTMENWPLAQVCYGHPGIGKTSYGAFIQDCIFLIDPEERGIFTLKQNGLVAEDVPVLPVPKTFTDVLFMLESLADEDHKYKVLVVDTIGGLSALNDAEVLEKDFHGVKTGKDGFNSYGQGHLVAKSRWSELLEHLNTLRSKKQMRIVLLAHAYQELVRDPIHGEYHSWKPHLPKPIWGLTHKWADMVTFMHREVFVDQKGLGSGGTRMMYHEWQPGIEAKNRHGLPAEMEMGAYGEAWLRICKAVSEARERNKNGSTT